MFKNKKSIIVCAREGHIADMVVALGGNVRIEAIEHFDNVIYMQFITKYRARKLARIIKEKLYKTETRILDNIIFVEFK